MPTGTEDKTSIDFKVSEPTCSGTKFTTKLAIVILALWGLGISYHRLFRDEHKSYQNIPELIIVDSLYNVQMNAINLSDESFSTKRAQRKSVKADYEFKVNSITQTYRENFDK